MRHVEMLDRGLQCRDTHVGRHYLIIEPIFGLSELTLKLRIVLYGRKRGWLTGTDAVTEKNGDSYTTSGATVHQSFCETSIHVKP